MISKLIASRRAVFPVQYNDEPISKEEIQTLLEAANWAPTHKRTEPWRFKVFHSEDSRKKLSEFMGAAFKETATVYSEIKQQKVMEKPLQAACVIAICMQRDPKESLPEWEEIASVAMAVQNMWLQATQLGIGAYWGSPGFLNRFGNTFSLAEGERCIGLFFMGKYDGEPLEGMRNSPIEEKTTWI